MSLGDGGAEVAAPGTSLVPAVVAVAAFVVVGLAVWLFLRRVYGRAAEQERQPTWYATIVGTGEQVVTITGANGPIRDELMITVYYRRDDGRQGSMSAYVSDHQRQLLPGAWGREAPTYEALAPLKQGDRLFKPQGALYPAKVT